MLKFFKSELSLVSVVKKTTTLEDGEYINTDNEPDEIPMIVRPLTFSELKNLPEGEYTTEDKKFYHEGDRTFRYGDEITYKDIHYKIIKIQDRFLEGKFTLYIGKRLPENDY